MRPKQSPSEQSDESTLPFDVTQEIDPGIVAALLGKAEPTSTQTGLDDVTVVLPQGPKR
jgi:hypothetical protein